MQQTLEKVCLNINLIRFDQRYYIKSYCTSNVLPLPLLPYLRLHRDSDVAELQCNVLIKKKQFLHRVDCVCAMFKNALNFTTFIKRNRKWRLIVFIESYNTFDKT